jgi:hypothetical protein
MQTLEERVASMPNSSLRPRGGVLLACAVFLAALIAPAASAAPVPVDLRVVDTAGFTMAEQTQFTDTVTFKSAPEADCFGSGTGGSGNDVTIQGPTALGAVVDASQADADLRPIWVTDHFSFGLGLCAIGGKEPTSSGFWYLKVNHVGSQVGGDQAAVKSGDRVLWYLSPGFPPPDELELVAPTQARPGEPFEVSVFSYPDDGTRAPAAGAVVSGAFAPTDANGSTTINPAVEGTFPLQATRGADIPSNVVNLTVDEDLDPCATQASEEIVGTRKRDKIDGTASPDAITARGGDDRVRVAGGCSDVVDCGSGRDKATVDPSDAVRRCNKVRVH